MGMKWMDGWMDKWTDGGIDGLVEEWDNMTNGLVEE